MDKNALALLINEKICLNSQKLLSGTETSTTMKTDSNLYYWSLYDSQNICELLPGRVCLRVRKYWHSCHIRIWWGTYWTCSRIKIWAMNFNEMLSLCEIPSSDFCKLLGHVPSDGQKPAGPRASPSRSQGATARPGSSQLLGPSMDDNRKGHTIDVYRPDKLAQSCCVQTQPPKM